MSLSVPNLPGYRPNNNRKQAGADGFARKQIWSISHGVAIADEPIPNVAELVRSGSAASIPLALQPKIKDAGKRYLNQGGVCLRFFGYFKEAVYESSIENYRVRHCEINYFLEDDTMSICEKKQENSGVPQGTFAKRQRIVRDEGEETFYDLNDLVIGGTLDIYGRTFFITDCNNSTRKYLHDVVGRSKEELHPMPGEEDVYTTMRAEFMSRETGRDDSVAHNIRKNPMKVFAEAQLGKTVNNATREGFLEYDRKVLRLDCLWDDRDSLYGDLQRFTLQYYLADDTMELLTVLGPNAGRDPFKKMCKRGKLAKDRDDPLGPCWHWSDFQIGTVIDCYSKMLLIVSADVVSYQFYAEKGMPLDPPLQLSVEEPVVAKRELPPYNGFGSEEDSLASCVGSLIPTVPKAKLGENKTMRFMAKMESTNPEDVERVFTISFFLVDNTVQIHEPPKRNSGIVGGSFLSRMKLRTAEGLITQEYFYVGAEIQLAGHAFILVDADDGTLRHMENNNHIFEYSNLKNVCEVYGLSLREAAASGELSAEFQSMDASGSSSVSIKSLKQLLMKYKCSYYYGGPPEQAVLTLCRKLGNKTSLNYEKFVAALVDSSVLDA
ncbi:hypothetical protein TL16_g00594 [Triparma laevis f. inornata]|uniref:DM10 domain-containing protein n=2 Tax=Triparma laevis TaxID=1534972 RepID=A0A9W7FQR1_9STRA|nr:hypothetical protein TL16_g00594 [Triparma laevis f. inornata]GMI16298.1 hypothetical protein TrLO_g11956 [Triparma laevis f. longispina]